MAIHRVPKTVKFTRIPNSILKDQRLSEKARGLICRMLANKDNWRFSIEYLARTGKDGKASIATQLRELEKYGYLRRRRVQGENGEFFWEYDVFEDPKLNSPDTEIPDMVNPDLVTPDRDSPDTGNSSHNNNNNIDYTLHKNDHINLSSTDCSSDGCSNSTRETTICSDQIETSIDLEKDRVKVRENIAYDKLIVSRADDRRLLDQIIEVMVSALASRQNYRIDGARVNANNMHEKLLSLNDMHIDYVLDCMKKTTSDIKNIRSYLLTALYRAPDTIDWYYQTLEQRDEARRQASIH